MRLQVAIHVRVQSKPHARWVNFVQRFDVLAARPLHLSELFAPTANAIRTIAKDMQRLNWMQP